MKLNRNIKIFINYFFGPLLFIWLSWSIYRQIKHQPNLDIAWQQIYKSLHSPLLWNLAAVVGLMFVNWSIEAVKWKISIRPLQQISFMKALKAILSGVSFSVSTPNRVGEYLGRMLYMKEGNRLKVISITMAGSISQLIITLAMGGTGLVLFRSAIETSHSISPVWMDVLIYGVAGVVTFLTLFYFRLSRIVKWFDRWPGNRRLSYLVETLEDFDATLLLKLLSFSLLRFFVFIIQYYLLFRLFQVDILWWQAFWGVSISFLIMAVIPTFTIAELAQRGYVAKMIIGLFSINQAGIVFATAGIWFINLIIPAIIGSLLILWIKKIYTNKNEET